MFNKSKARLRKEGCKHDLCGNCSKVPWYTIDNTAFNFDNTPAITQNIFYFVLLSDDDGVHAKKQSVFTHLFS
jgi:hypothetical protein